MRVPGGCRAGLLAAALGLAGAAAYAAAVTPPPPPAPTTAAPVLRAGSRDIVIRDGDRVLEGLWRADPAVALDVFDARRGRAAKRVTFVSDRDSLGFDVRPGETHDFVIALAEGGTCPTRISTRTGSFTRLRSGRAAGPDTIPITLAGGKVHVRGSLNGSSPLDLIFDTGADVCVLYPSGVRKGAKLRFDGEVQNTGTGGSTVRQRSSDNRLEVSSLRWEHEPVLFVERQADRADGIVGYTVFEDRVVEFDFVRGLLVVHDSLPALMAGFRPTPLRAAGTLTAVGVELLAGNGSASGPFVLDTAGNGTLIVHPSFAAAHGLRGALRRLGSSASRGVGRAAVRNDVLLLPELSLAGIALRDVPIDVEQDSGTPGDGPAGALCMAVLGRFDVFLDYPRGQAWFRPNARLGERFPRRGPGSRPLTGIAIATAIAVALAVSTRGRRPPGEPGPAAGREP